MQTYWTNIAWGTVFRFIEALTTAAPTILCGLFVVGVLRRLLGHENTRRLFGSGHWWALPQAWALGMLLPVCSLGVIPVCREMRRAGITGGVLLAFALSAPLFNPLSLMYGLTLSKPFAIFAFAGCSLIVLTFVGGLWDRLCPGVEQHESEPGCVRPGLRRMLAIGVSICQETASPTLLYILIGLLGVAVLAGFLPFGSLQTALNAGDPKAPLVMLGVGLPAYAPPMTAMMQIGSMFHHGNSIGAAFVLLTIGAGTNLGLLTWVIANYGWKRALAWLALVVAIVLGLAYAIELPLRDVSSINLKHVKDNPHTHAFDIYCQPFPPASPVDATQVAKMLRDKMPRHEVVSLVTIGLLLLTGTILRRPAARFSVDDWLEQPAPLADTPSPSMWDKSLPATALGGVALAGIVVVSILGCYIYYPRPETALADLSNAKIEVYSAAISGDHEAAEQSIDWCADLTRRLEVGVYIREFHLSEQRRQYTKSVRDLLEQLDHAIEEGDDKEQVLALARAVTNACADCRMAFLDPATR
ncbi:MAG TPA: permease [Pirellulales bacterium]|nr:permease [Pirellulales bacterium]